MDGRFDKRIRGSHFSSQSDLAITTVKRVWNFPVSESTKFAETYQEKYVILSSKVISFFLGQFLHIGLFWTWKKAPHIVASLVNYSEF